MRLYSHLRKKSEIIPLHWLTKKFISKKLSQFTFGWRVFAIFVLGLHRGASTKKEDHTLIAHGFRES